ncbi:hypothetical protein FACS189472_16200 [Alphaproteobacteria bacterium]|nr:hypothetical protein FACS189472_16200 [Alphaproteobacteria bacterium]
MLYELLFTTDPLTVTAVPASGLGRNTAGSEMGKRGVPSQTDRQTGQDMTGPGRV